MTAASTRHTARADVALEKPGRYLQQLCKHFAHKLPGTTFSATEGRIPFPMGTCDLDATSAADTLILCVAAENADDLARLEDVVARHLERFTFREETAIAWTRDVAA